MNSSADPSQLPGRLYVEGFTGKAIVPFLGSEDRRTAQGVGIGVFLESPRSFRYRSVRPEILIEGYYHRSTSKGVSGSGPNATDAYGVLALVRYSFADRAGTSFYFDWGWGLQYTDMRTIDLSGRLNSTPTVGVGLTFHAGRQELTVGARLMHISDAGLQGNNQGQNQLMLTVGFRF